MKTTMGVIAAMLLGGCMGATALQGHLQGRSGELMYLRELRATERQGGTVSIGSISVEHELPPATTVRKTGGWVVPLLLVNVWRGEYVSDLGAAQIANDYQRFMRESLAEDLKRGARYTVVDQGGDLQVDVRITKVEMRAPIVETGNFIFLLLVVSWGSGVYAGPVDVAIEGEAVARRGGREVLRKAVQGSARSGVLTSRKGAQIAEYTLAMVEALSLAVKSFNGAVVDEVNRL